MGWKCTDIVWYNCHQKNCKKYLGGIHGLAEPSFKLLQYVYARFCAFLNGLRMLAHIDTRFYNALTCLTPFCARWLFEYCARIWMHVFVCTYLYAWVYLHVSVYTCLCTHDCMHVFICALFLTMPLPWPCLHMCCSLLQYQDYMYCTEL